MRITAELSGNHAGVEGITLSGVEGEIIKWNTAKRPIITWNAPPGGTWSNTPGGGLALGEITMTKADGGTTVL